jgi:tetratricopeptide (TPR) repeat protein
MAVSILIAKGLDMAYIYSTNIFRASLLKRAYMKLVQHFVLLMILAVTFLSFANTLSYDFTNLDEEPCIILNPHIRDLSVSGIITVFSSMDLNLYTPLVTLSFAVDYALWGLNPAGYHVVNLLLHLLNTCLVFWFCRRLSRSIVVAGIAACLFGVHPVHVESVAWITERKDLLFTAFALGSLLTYDDYRRPPQSRVFYAASIFMFLSSLLAKPQAVALPAVMLLMDYFHDNPFDFRRSLNRVWPFAALAAIFCGLTLYFSVLTYNPGIYVYANACNYAWWNRPFLVTYGICFYIVKLIWPFNLTAIYECPHGVKGILSFEYYLSAFGTALLLWVTWRLWKHRNKLAFGILFYLLMLLPVLQIVPFGPVIVAERYAYLSSAGILFIAALVIVENIKQRPGLRCFWGTAVAIVILGLALLTYERNQVWANSLALFTDVISKNPRSAIAYNNRGVARYRQSDFAGASQDYNTAIRLEPKYVDAFFNRAVLRNQTGDLAGALGDYTAAVVLDPGHAKAYYNRGLIFDAEGKTDHALRDFRLAILSNPDFALAYAARGTIKAGRREYYQALADFKNAVRLNPADTNTWFNMAKVYFALSNSAAARLCFENGCARKVRK